MTDDLTPNVLPTADGYEEFLSGLKERIRTAQVKAALAVNAELIQLYWEIGQSLWERQQSQSWGEAIIVNLAKDLQAALPKICRRRFPAWKASPGATSTGCAPSI